MQITREWLDQVSDNQGLTPGQQKLLTIWVGAAPYFNKMIPDEIAAFIEKCKGWRQTSQQIKALRQSWMY